MAPQHTVDFELDVWDTAELTVPSLAAKEEERGALEAPPASSSAEISTDMTTSSRQLPPSILRRRFCPGQQEEGVTETTLPSHWPKGLRVHWADGPRRPLSSSPPSVVTAIYTRPRTLPTDVSALYYSALDVKNFKREFRALLRSQKLAKQRLQQNSEQRFSEERTTTTLQHRDNSFWRSKVSRWSAQTKATSTVSDSPASDYDEESLYSTDDEAVDSMSQSHEGGGIFSSVFDVAREAVSIFGTSSTSTSSSSAYYQKDRAPQHHHHLIDTLYLF